MASINLEIDIFNSCQIKSRYRFSARGCILLDKVRKNSALYCVGFNYIEL